MSRTLFVAWMKRDGSAHVRAFTNNAHADRFYTGLAPQEHSKRAMLYATGESDAVRRVSRAWGAAVAAVSLDTAESFR